ncbi:glycerophosphodiester phosphodiesterase domain-containing protein 4 [Marmota flaviventris]
MGFQGYVEQIVALNCQRVVYLGTGYWLFWSIFLLSFAAVMVTYTSLLLILGSLLLWERIELYLHTCHKILIMIMITLCTFILSVICIFWKDKWLIAGLSLQIFAPVVQPISIIVMVILSWPLAMYVGCLEREVIKRRRKITPYEKARLRRCNIFTRLRALQIAAGLPFFLILLCLYAMPLGVYSPCIQEKEELGPKPVFFAHRGAPMAGPENTMMAFEKAVEQGAYGLETDIHVSFDHVPYLMHDYDLRRTTNIKEVLPEDAFKHPAFFTWDFLKTLNAGKWFIKPERRPFFNMGPISEADKKRASNQSIPQLTDLLEIAKKEQKFLIFDLFGPPPKHPLRNTFVREVVRVILDSKIAQHLIFWLPSHDREYVKYTAPGFQHVGRLLSIEDLAKENINIINVDYKKLFYSGLRDYKAANININLYVVNEPWLYSLAWCSRINSVTTDNIPLLSQLNHPQFFMSPTKYLFIWLFTDIVSAVFIIAIFSYCWWREIKKEKLQESSKTRTDQQNINLEVSRLPVKPPARIVQTPWIPVPLQPALTRNVQKHPESFHFVQAPKNKITPLTPIDTDDKSVMSTEIIEHTQASPWEDNSESTFQTTVTSLKTDELAELAMPSTEYSPETQIQEITSVHSEESFVTLHSTTSSFKIQPKKN